MDGWPWVCWLVSSCVVYCDVKFDVDDGDVEKC